MFQAFLSFELRYWLRGYMVWVFLLILSAMFFAGASTDQVTIGGALENTYRNAPFVIQNYYAVACILAMLMATAFVNSAAGRDFQYNTHGLVFTTPLSKRDYLLGRFLGSAAVAVIPVLGVSVGLLVAKYMPWVQPERWGPVNLWAHLNGIFYFAIPNTLIAAAILFTIAVLTRSTLASFIGALAMLVALGIADSLTSDLENEFLGMLADPLGARVYAIVTKYWTVAEKNTRTLGLHPMMLLNRALWLGVAGLVFAFGYHRFRFEERSAKAKKAPADGAQDAAPAITVPPVRFWFDATGQWAQFLGTVRAELAGMFQSTTFLVILAMGLLNTLPNLMLNAAEMYGVSSLPVTYKMLDMIRGTLYLFLVALITYFAGALVWRERDARMDEIYDALPHPNWVPYAAKFVALIFALTIILATAMSAGVAVQAYHKYTRFQVGLYATELFVFDLLPFVYLTVLAFFIHVLTPNKYLGYFVYIVFLIANLFIWRPLNIGTRMVRFASLPDYTYSDLYHYAPYLQALFWFALYWLLLCGLLAVASIALWPRGREAGLRARLEWHGALRPLTAALALLWLGAGGWVYYNTKVLNSFTTEKQRERRAADYERTYKKYETLPQPRVETIRYSIDIFPTQRNLVLKAAQTLRNKTAAPISEIHFTLTRDFETEIQIPGARLKHDDPRLVYRIYELSPPLAPGATLSMQFTVRGTTRGFENSVSHQEVVQNGTFFNNQIAPQIGYQPATELTERNDRKEQGLPERDRMPELERNCGARCGNTYLSNNSDWVNVETVISTEPDQIAVAPGSLLREWTANGRRYFHYQLDHDSLNFYSFISARYTVAREEFDGVQAEVYYHHEHPWNVPKMLDSIRQTIAYCRDHFGPYRHKQARIIEFPRVARFAQAFPGTMPYSEAIGFIANLNNPDDIDMVYYVVAHEIGHQWWAHQVIGANMQGATLLSESLAQYTALMVMERRYGRDIMRKFLSYEMDRYLRARGAELLRERPLLRVDASQGYIHYQKGSVVLYYLKEMIGEEAVNRALRKTIAQWAYQGPPYPTAHHLVDNLREVTPPELQYLITDLFEQITLFSNRTLTASAKKRPDGRFDVAIEVETQKLTADETGAERQVAVNDWIEIGAFAKPPKGKKYGATLHRERVRITQLRNRFTFTVAELPEKAGIDPFSLLIDRIPDDNLKRVTVSE